MYLLPLKVNYNSLIFSLLFLGSNLLYAKDAMVFDADNPDKAALKLKEEAAPSKKAKKSIETTPLIKPRKSSVQKPLEKTEEKKSALENNKEAPEENKTSPIPTAPPSAPVEKEIDGDLYEEVPEE